MKKLLTLLLLSGLAACGGQGGPSGDGGGGGVTVALQKPAGSGDAQTGMVGDTLTAPLVVLVTEDGAPAAGRVVTFAPFGGGGSMIPAVDTTGVDGKASAIWILGNGAGTRQARATSPGATGSPLTFSATATPAPAATLLGDVGQSQSQESGLLFSQQVGVRVVDTFGNNVPNVIVTWAVTAGSAILGAAADTTGADGKAAVTVQAGDTAGPITIAATAPSLAGSPVQFSLSVTPLATHVEVRSNFFTPDTVDIPAGGAVKWIWVNGTHNVTQLTGPAIFPASPSQSAGASFGPLVFDVAGTYTYECTLHSGMTATIRVGLAVSPRPGVQR